MRAVVQRVRRASVRVGEATVAAIGTGYVVLIGVQQGDGGDDVAYLCRKVAGLRLMADRDGKMNQALDPARDAVLAVSQFTLLGDTRRGLRPSFDAAARPEQAKPLYEAVVEGIRRQGLRVETGVFQADMEVELVNDGPVTVILDSRNA